MNRLLTLASAASRAAAAGACRTNSSGSVHVGIIRQPHQAAFATTMNSSSSLAQRYFVVRHFADTSSSSSSSSSSPPSLPSADDDTTTTTTGTTTTTNDNNNTQTNTGDDDDSDDSNIQRGTVKLFNKRHGWGFIIPDGVDKRKHKEEELIFIHRVDIKMRNNDLGGGGGGVGVGEKGYFPK